MINTKHNNTNNICEVDLISLSHDGRGIGRMDNKVIFITNALPGQKVRAIITKSKKSFAEAKCLEVLKDSPDYIKAPCPHADICGGCPLQSIPNSKQLFWKERMLKDALERIAKLNPIQMQTIQPIISSPKEFHYRNKMEFAFGHDELGELTLGMRSKASHNVINVPHCKLLPTGCMDIIQNILKSCKQLRLKAFNPNQEKPTQAEKEGILRHLIIRCPHNLNSEGKGQLLINLIVSPCSKNLRLSLSRLGSNLMQMCPSITGFILEERRSQSMIAEGEHVITRLGQPYLYEKLDNINYKLNHNSFFQVNTEAATIMCKQIIAMTSDIKKENACIWDMYCGVGAPGLNLALAVKASNLYGVEINASAINMAKQNAKNNGLIEAHYETNDVKKAISKWPKPDLILVDPPRTGLDPKVIKICLQSKAKNIIYVSCNPATLARDLALLTQGYTLEKIVPIDFFPHTAHVESCTLLSLT